MISFIRSLSMLFMASLLAFPGSETKIVSYTLEIYYFSASPDGTGPSKVLGINGQSPGPTLEANIGDTFEITLINSINDGQNTSLHWHGIHQKDSLFEDGASMIVQCPLPPGESMLYRFNATQAGTFWYHSHVNSQYTEGMLGPLIIHNDKEAYQYDGEVTLTLTDWYHQTAHENEKWHLSPISRGVPPYPYAGLINGMGRYPCEYATRLHRHCEPDLQYRPVIRVQRDKTYRFRVINAAAVSAFNFSIDHHKLHAIEVDGIDVAKPVTADIASIAAGQRYSFLVSCNEFDHGKNDSRYIIRASLRTDSLMLIEGVNINKHPEALMGDMSAIFECVDQDLNEFPHSVEVTKEVFTCYDVVPPSEFVEMTYLDEMALSPLDGIPAPDHFDEEFILNADFFEDHEDIRRGSFNRTPFVLPHDKPLLMKLIDGERIPLSAVPLEIQYGSIVQIVINNPFYGPHPFHLHGHHFWVLGTGESYEGDYNPTKHNLTIHGVKRDTVLVQEQSWAVIRFVADNPGVWIFHCHIDWHNLSGMALTFIEGADIVRNTMDVTDEALRVCKMHDENFSLNTIQTKIPHKFSPKNVPNHLIKHL